MTPVKLVRIRGAMLISLSMSTWSRNQSPALRPTWGTAARSTQETPAYLQVGREGVGQPHVSWEGTEDEIPQLDAVWWNHVTEAVVVVTQELWEVVQQDQQHPQRALKQPRGRGGHARRPSRRPPAGGSSPCRGFA